MALIASVAADHGGEGKVNDYLKIKWDETTKQQVLKHCMWNSKSSNPFFSFNKSASKGFHSRLVRFNLYAEWIVKTEDSSVC